MDRKVCLDSDIQIEILKNNQQISEKIIELKANLYTTSINIFEIWTGRLKKQEDSAKQLIRSLKKINFDENSALKAGDINLELKKSGELLDIRDVFIASICISNNLELFTLNKKHFERLTKFGLKLI